MSVTRKYLLLLAAIAVMLVTQPLLPHGSVFSRVTYDVLTAGAVVSALHAILGSARERWVGLALVLPALAASVLHYALHDALRTVAETVYHLSLTAFLGHAIAAILRGIFAERAIGTGDILGAFAGYVLIGVAWGNLFALAELFFPGSISVSPAIAWRLDDWHARRALFDYFSFTTLTSLGYGDVTPVAPPATTFSWLEVMLGQFYIAVVIAQLVGRKLAQGLRAREPESR